MRPALGVNVDHIATLRQARGTTYPDPVEAAFAAEAAGADQITVHLREDRRHIQDRDVRVLRETVQTVLNLEMAASPEMLAFALETRPNTVTLVPERREERTTEGGLDCTGNADALRRVIDALRGAGIAVSLFIDPDLRQISAAQGLAVPIIELHTGDYAEAPTAAAVDTLRRAAVAASDAGIAVAAGHGLTVRNVRPLLEIPEIREYNIGHSIVARAALIGFDAAVREMLAALGR